MKPRLAVRQKPGPEGLERLDAFLGDFLLPMLADGQIDAEEETPLVVAYHAYGIDDFDFWFVRTRAEDRIQFGVPGHSRSFAKAWARIQLQAERMTRNDFLRTREWLQNQARQAGITHLTLPDADPGTIFSVLSIDRTCIGRFRKLLETMRACNLPIAPASALPQAELTEEDAGAAVADAPGSVEAGDVDGAAAVEPLPQEREVAADPDSETAPVAAEEAAAAVPEIRDVPIPEEVADSIPELAERLRREAPEILETFRSLLAKAPGEASPLLYDRYRTCPANQAVVIPEDFAPETPVWFLGDLHGDLLALEAALYCLTKANLEATEGTEFPNLVLLGDLFDDGDHSYEVVLRVMELVTQHPGRITVLAGNHDEALAFDPESGMFRSSVSPSDFTDWLNSQAAEDETVRGVGEAVVEWFGGAPRALFFPDGLIAAHGGVPLSDLWESLKSPEDLDQPACLQDFVWTRAHPRAKRKIPNRTTRGCEFGFEDLAGFCEAASRALGGRPVMRLVRGHDHVEERYQLYPKYVRHPVLTVNAMSRRLAREVFGPYARVPAVGLYMPGQLPQVHRLVVSEDAIRRVYPEPRDDAEENSETRPQALDAVAPDGQ